MPIKSAVYVPTVFCVYFLFFLVRSKASCERVRMTCAERSILFIFLNLSLLFVLLL